MGEIAAHAGAPLQRLRRRGQRIADAVAVFDIAADPVADRGDAPKAGIERAEFLFGDSGEPVGLAEPARLQEGEQLERHLGDRDFADAGGIGAVQLQIGGAGVADA